VKALYAEIPKSSKDLHANNLNSYKPIHIFFFFFVKKWSELDSPNQKTKWIEALLAQNSK
jgi:hypothetical protein